jgi:hypothetical protein
VRNLVSRRATAKPAAVGSAASPIADLAISHALEEAIMLHDSLPKAEVGSYVQPRANAHQVALKVGAKGRCERLGQLASGPDGAALRRLREYLARVVDEIWIARLIDGPDWTLLKAIGHELLLPDYRTLLKDDDMRRDPFG